MFVFKQGVEEIMDGDIICFQRFVMIVYCDSAPQPPRTDALYVPRSLAVTGIGHSRNRPFSIY